MAEGRSALANLGFSKFPVGTLEEIQEQGLDELKVASCSKPVKDQRRGCAMWDLCRFNHKSMGGFKGQGPKYVGYRIIDPTTGELGTNQGTHICFAWVHGLQKRADFGAAARRESNGTKGEVIRVVAQEGEEIQVRHNLPINNKGEVVNVMPEMLEDLKRSNIKHSLLPTEVATGRKDFVVTQTVPYFKRMQEQGGETFSQMVAMMDLEKDEETRHSIDYGASQPRMTAAPAAKVVAEPVKRTPKVRNEEDQG